MKVIMFFLFLFCGFFCSYYVVCLVHSSLNIILSFFDNEKINNFFEKIIVIFVIAFIIVGIIFTNSFWKLYTANSTKTNNRQPTSSSVSSKKPTSNNDWAADLDEVPDTTEITGPLSKKAYWTSGGKSYHFSSNCTSLKRSSDIWSGTLKEATAEGKRDPCNLCADGS